jgi:glutathione peroxidase
MEHTNIYQFKVNKLNGEEVSLSAYKDKVLLIVNTASQCGFAPQLADLVELKKIFQGQDFEILDFPSNDFGGQEPLNGEELVSYCEIQHVNFPVFDKIRVRGPYAHPLYKYFADKKENGKFNSTPRWNFHKFLINRNGMVSDFYFPFTKPTISRIKKQITRLLGPAK